MNFLLLASLAASQQVYDLEKVSLVLLPKGSSVVLEQECQKQDEIWVPGTYPHPDLIFSEGRFGELVSQNGLKQKFTVKCRECEVGQVISLDFWLVHQDTPELWFTNQDQYFSLHKDSPFLKNILVKVVAPHSDEL